MWPPSSCSGSRPRWSRMDLWNQHLCRFPSLPEIWNITRISAVRPLLNELKYRSCWVHMYPLGPPRFASSLRPAPASHFLACPMVDMQLGAFSCLNLMCVKGTSPSSGDNCHPSLQKIARGCGWEEAKENSRDFRGWKQRECQTHLKSPLMIIGIIVVPFQILKFSYNVIICAPLLCHESPPATSADQLLEWRTVTQGFHCFLVWKTVLLDLENKKYFQSWSFWKSAWSRHVFFQHLLGPYSRRLVPRSGKTRGKIVSRSSTSATTSSTTAARHSPQSSSQNTVGSGPRWPLDV